MAFFFLVKKVVTRILKRPIIIQNVTTYIILLIFNCKKNKSSVKWEIDLKISKIDIHRNINLLNKNIPIEYNVLLVASQLLKKDIEKVWSLPHARLTAK